MKKLLSVVLALILLAPCHSVSAQGFSAKELNDKASKAARKEAKKLEKEGWKASLGALPVDKQLDRAYMMQYEYTVDMAPKYIMGDAMSIGGNYDTAKIQATELAKQNLAGQIQTEVAALIENSLTNNQITAQQAETIDKCIMSSKSFISQKLGRVMPVIEVFRTLPNNNKQVMVRIAYSSETARNIAKKAILNEMEKEGDSLGDKLDEILGL